jgi:hypothetical protein
VPGIRSSGLGARISAKRSRVDVGHRAASLRRRELPRSPPIQRCSGCPQSSNTIALFALPPPSCRARRVKKGSWLVRRSSPGDNSAGRRRRDLNVALISASDGPQRGRRIAGRLRERYGSRRPIRSCRRSSQAKHPKNAARPDENVGSSHAPNRVCRARIVGQLGLKVPVA